MNKSAGLGLLIGLAAGLIGGALIAKSRAPKGLPTVVQSTPPPPPPPPLPPPPAEPVPDPEVERLTARVAELEAKLAAAPKSEPAPAPPPPVEGGSDQPDWSRKLRALLRTGVQSYKSAEFQSLVEDLKKAGKDALRALEESLLRGESAGERFLAAALLEDLDDPAAIPALAGAMQKDEDPLVRRMSSHAIAMIRDEVGLPSLRTAMAADSDWGVRVNAAYGVAKLGQPDGVKTLEEAYKSAPAEHKLPVLGGLADVGAASSAPIFRKILAESSDISYLYVSISYAQKLGDVSFVPELNRIAADPKYSTNVREMAKKAAESLSK